MRLLSALGGVAVALAAGEATVRLLNLGPMRMAVTAGAIRYSANPRLGYEFLPGARYHDVKINADGMKDRDHSLDKPAHTFRVVCIGDSICAGFTLKQADVVSSRLERLLNRNCATPDRGFEVLSLGVPGYNITQVMENLRVRGLKYDPDVIIYLYCLNDPQEYSYELETLRSRVSKAKREYFERVSRTGRWLVLNSRMYSLYRYIVDSRGHAGNKRPAVRPDEQFEHLRRNTYAGYYEGLHQSPAGWSRVCRELSLLSQLARRNEASTYVAIVPVLREVNDYPLGRVHAMVADAARERSLSVIDLLEPFRTLEQSVGDRFRQDDLHPGKLGHALMAVVLLAEMTAQEPALDQSPGLEAVANGDDPEASIARALLDRGSWGQALQQPGRK